MQQFNPVNNQPFGGDNTTPQTVGVSPNAVGMNPSRGKKILIVEDEVPLLKALSSKFSSEGYLVSEAIDGNEGFTKAQAERPDLIITDIVMPDMNGLTMIKNIRETEWGKSIEIILLTNLNNSDDVATAMLYGVEDYMVKSDMKLKDIVEKVNNKFIA